MRPPHLNQETSFTPPRQRAMLQAQDDGRLSSTDGRHQIDFEHTDVGMASCKEPTTTEESESEDEGLTISLDDAVAACSLGNAREVDRT